MRPGKSPSARPNRGPNRGRVGLFLAGICVVASLSSAACLSGETADQTPQIDAGTDAGPDVVPMADAASPEAGPDAADAKPDVVVPPAHFCAGLAPAPKFCDDFDDGNLTNGWTQ